MNSMKSTFISQFFILKNPSWTLEPLFPYLQKKFVRAEGVVWEGDCFVAMWTAGLLVL